MEFNRLITLILGFVILILLFVWVNNRLRSGNNKTVSTVQITPTKITPTKTVKKDENNRNPFAFIFDFGNTTPTITSPARLDPTERAGGPKLTLTLTPTQTLQSTQPTSVQPSPTVALPKVKVIQGATPQASLTPQTPTQIPQTGAPTLLTLLAPFILTGAVAFRKRI